MGLAIDTILAQATMGATPALTAVTLATGDSLTVRNFTGAAQAILEEIGWKGSGTGVIGVRSPMMHDDVHGIRAVLTDSPARLILPEEVGEPLIAQDTLIEEVEGGASAVQATFLRLFYSDLPGAAARLAMWGDISARIRHLKMMEVDITTNPTAGLWQDAVITTTEDLLHANTDYAVLGYLLDVACCAVGIRGQETGNLRVCGIGSTDPNVTADAFVQMSRRSGRPHIPIFNSANKGSTYVTAADSGTSTALRVNLVLAELGP